MGYSEKNHFLTKKLLGTSQCDQIGRVLKGLGKKILLQKEFLGYSEKNHFLTKKTTRYATFGQLLKKWATFYTDIKSLGIS